QSIKILESYLPPLTPIMPFVNIYNLAKSNQNPIHARYCSTFFCRFRGLMMSDQIPFDQGLLLVQKKDSKIDTAVHMFFMRYDIAVVWIDSHLKVVDTRLAQRWHSLYVPNTPAKYILEVHVGHLDHFSPGDMLKFEYD
ncbi:MAG: DUF192 domain-containing protein, partial [Anaerolineaceae bacterium]|nr:DUF192 domain-containing protein [Anaerolineaceae bacterium]